MAGNASRDLTYNLIGKDVSATATLNKTAASAESMSSRISGAISKAANQIGGPLGSMLNGVSDVIDKLGESGASAGAKLAVAGGGVLALGFALSELGSKDQAAQAQLKTAIEDTGGSWSDYSDQVEKAIGKEENYAHSASDTQNALATLTTATQDPTKALADLGVVANLAAVKHESLADAANTVAKILGGSGSKTLRQFGIDMTVTAGNTAEADQAIAELSTRIQGQASASVDSFSGKVDVLKTKVEDFVSKIGAKAGPVLQTFGAAAMITGTALDILSAHQDKVTAANLKTSASSVLATGTTEALGDAAVATGVEVEGAADATVVAASEIDIALGPVGWAIGAITLAVGLGAAAWGIFSGSQKKAAQPIADLTSLLVQQNGVFDANTRATVISAEQAKNLFTNTDKLGFSQSSLTDGLNGNTDAYNANVGALQAAIAAGTTYTKINEGVHGADVVTVTTLNDKAKAATSALNAYKGLSASEGVNTKQAADAIAAGKSTTAVIVAQETALNAVSTFWANYSDNLLSAAQAGNSFLDAEQAVTEAVTQNGKSLDDSTVKGRANAEAIESAIQAAKAHADAVFKQTGNVSAATAAMNGDNTALETAAKKAGLNTAAVDAMVKKYGQVPSDVETQVILNTQNAMTNMNNYRAALAALPKVATTNAGTYGGYNAKSHSASGGIIGMAGGGIKNLFGTDVDEFGNELLDMGTGKVYPAGQSKQMENGSGRGGGVVNHIYITMPTVTSPTADDGRRAVAAVQQFLKAGGRTGF